MHAEMSDPSMPPEHASAIRDYLSQNQQVSVRVPVLGKEYSGRRGVIQRLVYDHDDYGPDGGDIGEDSMRIQIDGHPVVVELCMYIGAEEDSCYQRFVRAGDAFLLVYDVAKRDSFESAVRTHRELLGPEQQQGKPVWVCATRSDRPPKDWVVSAQEGSEFSRTIGARFLSVSSKTGQGLDEAFVGQIVRKALLNRVLISPAGPGQDLHPKSPQEASCLPLFRVRNKLRGILNKKAL
ncbi:P-loop containing nucleoside triphosphate hydrolase protein [Thelonectria olida]|uniref:P-loop containing nucleoside triphosphate hydrolase protein n=1 Tax=Thelonectria olida TaxID=1576542 RepID=A0A9P9ATN2_9HYPO|nr:P-loop containing nucleoside triphosphate hydrolase protein [Thelonectria olida]